MARKKKSLQSKNSSWFNREVIVSFPRTLSPNTGGIMTLLYTTDEDIKDKV